ncbi:MAG: CPBP family glutamic-type intramembrane protease [Promethearchaeia archaeon]
MLSWIISSLLFEKNSIYFSLLFYGLRIFAVLFSIPLVLIISNKLYKNEDFYKDESDQYSLLSSQLRFFKITKKNMKYQILYSILLFEFIIVPIDFIICLFNPSFLIFNAIHFIFVPQNIFIFFNNILFFITFLIIIQLFNAVFLETIYRGFLIGRGSKKFNSISAVFIASWFYSIQNFKFFLGPISTFISVWNLVILFIESFILGIILGVFFVRKKWLIPIILVQTIRNVIYGFISWGYFNHLDIYQLIIVIYLPLLISGIILFILQFNRVKESISIGLKMFKDYTKYKGIIRLNKFDKIFIIICDFIIGFIISIFSILIL